MAIFYTPIYTRTLTQSTASFTFSNIPTNFTDLYLSISARNDGTNETIMLLFNGDTTLSNYTARRIYGNGSGTASNSFTGPFWSFAAGSGNTANTFGNSGVLIANYRSNTFKQVLSDSVTENNYSSVAQLYLVAGLWLSTSPVDSITIDPQVDPNMLAGSTFSLYGVTRYGV